MTCFEYDHLEGAHQRILERLSQTNFEQIPGYGADEHCERARELIKQACDTPCFENQVRATL